MGANFSPCSSSAGEVPPVLARRALRPLPVLRGGPHGGVQHAAVHPPRVQGHRCQGECCLCPALGSQGSVQQLLEGPKSRELPNAAGRRGCCPAPAAPLTTSSFLASGVGPVSSSLIAISTSPCLACAVHVGQVYNTGSPAASVCVCAECLSLPPRPRFPCNTPVPPAGRPVADHPPVPVHRLA